MGRLVEAYESQHGQYSEAMSLLDKGRELQKEFLKKKEQATQRYAKAKSQYVDWRDKNPGKHDLAVLGAMGVAALAAPTAINMPRQHLGAMKSYVKVAMKHGKEMADNVYRYGDNWTTSPSAAHFLDMYSRRMGKGSLGVADSFKHAMDAIGTTYDATQKSIKGDKIKLYRGLTNSDNLKVADVIGAHLHGLEDIPIQHRGVSSWTSKKNVAHRFAAGENADLGWLGFGVTKKRIETNAKGHGGIVIKREFDKKQIMGSSYSTPGMSHRFGSNEYIATPDIHAGNESIIGVPIKDTRTTSWGTAHPKHKTIESYVASLTEPQREKFKRDYLIRHADTLERAGVKLKDPKAQQMADWARKMKAAAKADEEKKKAAEAALKKAAHAAKKAGEKK